MRRKSIAITTAPVLSILTILVLLPGTMTPVFASDPGGTFFPRLDIDSNGDVHAVYWTAASGNNEIYYLKWNGTTGTILVDEVRTTTARGFSARPDIAIDSQDNVHLVWLDRREGGTNAEIYYEKLDNDGNTLVDDLRLTFADGSSVRPSMIMDSEDNIHVTWYDDRDDPNAGGTIGGVSSNHEIYYKKIDNNGTTIIDDIRVTNADGLSQRPYLDIDSNDDVHISFMDTRDAWNTTHQIAPEQYEIYYTKLDGDTGVKLVPDFRLTDNAGLSGRNALVMDSQDNAWITFMNGEDFPDAGNIEIYLTKLDINGNPLMDDDGDGMPDLIRLTEDPPCVKGLPCIDRFSVRPDMSIDLDDNVHISWIDERDGNREIYYEKLDNNANTLLDDVRISLGEGISDRTYLATDQDDDVHIIWQDDRAGRPELFYSKLDSSGNVLIDDMRITYGHPFGDPPSNGVAIDVLGNIQVLWGDERFENVELIYTKIDASNGTKLIDDKRITNADAYSIRPSIAVDSEDNIHIGWQDNRVGNMEIYHSKLDNEGNTLLGQRRLTFNKGYSLNARIGLDSSDNAHIVWRDTIDGFRNIYHIKLESNGTPLTVLKKLTETTNASVNPSFAVDASGNLHVVWQETRDGNFEIFYKKLDDIGNTLIDDIRMTNASGTSTRPDVGVDPSQNVHIVWSDERDGNPEVYYKKLDNSGNTLITDTRVTDNSAMSSDPSMKIDDSGEIAITWTDNRLGNGEIYFVKLDNNGTRLNTNDIRITFAPGRSYFADMAIEPDTGYSHIVWLDLNLDDHSATAELYYTKRAKFGGALIPPKRITFTVNIPPIADAGIDQTVQPGGIVTLDGTFSSDPDSSTLSYAWTQVGGQNVTLTSPGSANPTFTAPSNGGMSILTFQLLVHDGTDPSPSDTVEVTVMSDYEPSFLAVGDNYLDEPDRPDLRLQEFSFASWFRTSNDFTSSAMIVSKGGFGGEGAGENMNYGLYLNWGERIRMGFESTDGTNYFAQSPNSYNDGNAHYAVATYDLSILKLYVDGSIVATLSTTAIPDDGSSRPVRIAANSAAESMFFIGSIDEVRIWNRTLTDQEVSDQYNSAIFDTAGQVLYLDMSEPPVNNPPVSNNQTVSTAVNASLAITLTASDADGDPLTFSIVDNPSNATLSIITPINATAAGVTYTPNTGFNGTDSFTFKANDGINDSNIATVDVDVDVTMTSEFGFGQSFLANGTNYLDEPDKPDLRLQEFSLASWFRTSHDFTSNAMIVNKGGLGSGADLNYGMYLDRGERLVGGFESTTGTNKFVTSPNSYNDGNAHYAVVTYDRSILKLYVDGSIVATLSTSAFPDAGSSLPVRIAANSAAEDEFFNGSIDEVRIWNRPLTDQEVSDQYNSAIFDTAGQVLYLDMS